MTVIRAAVMSGWVIAAIALTACFGGDTSPTPTPSATVVASPTEPTEPTEPTATATPSPEELEAEVSAAYLAYWDGYAEALLNLDVALVDEWAVGDELRAIADEIETLRGDGVAARIVVEHDFDIVSLTATDAVVIDEYVNNSFYVDPQSKEPEEADGPGDVIRETVFLELVDGRWVVVRSVREASD